MRWLVSALLRLLVLAALAWALFHAGWIAGAQTGYRAGLDDTCPNAADEIHGTTDV